MNSKLQTEYQKLKKELEEANNSLIRAEATLETKEGEVKEAREELKELTTLDNLEDIEELLESIDKEVAELEKEARALFDGEVKEDA